MAFFTFNSSLSQIVERLGWVLVHSLWQFALIAMVSILAARVLHRDSSVLRYGLLVASMGFMVAASIVTYVVVPVSGEVGKVSRESLVPENVANPLLATTDTARLTAGAKLPPDDPRGERSVVSPPVPIATTLVSGSSGSDEYRRADAQPLASKVADLFRPWLTWIVGFWCIGMLISSLRPLLGWRTLRRLRRIGLSAPSEEVLAAFQRVFTRLGMRRVVNVYYSTLAKGPLVVGYLRPIVLLPVSLATSIPTAQLEAILAHELAHIRRHDFVINLLQTLIETLSFYHPAVWWLSHRIRIEREHCCDDLVIKLFNNAPDYGRALLAVEQLQGQTTSLALGAKDGSLLGRIRRIVNPDANHASSRSWLVFPLILCLCSMAAIVAVSIRSAVGVEDKFEDAEPVSAVAELPDGISVEFTALAAMEDNPKQWWTPNGAKLSAAPAYQLGGTVRMGDAPLRRALFQVRGIGDDATAVTANMSGERRIEQLATGDKVVLFSGGLQIQPGKQTASLRVGVATDSLSPVRILEANGQRRPTPENAAFDSVAEDIVVKSVNALSGGNKEVDGKLVPVAETELTFETPTAWRQPHLEIVAIDKEGNPHRNSGGGGAYPTDANATSTGMTEGIVMFPLPPEQIEGFEYQFRIYRHWATFENVSIDAGKSTVVKVVVDSVPDERIRAKLTDGTIVELLGVSTPRIELPSNDKREWWSAAGKLLSVPPVQPGSLSVGPDSADGREFAVRLSGCKSQPSTHVSLVKLFQNGQPIDMPKNGQSMGATHGSQTPEFGCTIESVHWPIGDADAATVEVKFGEAPIVLVKFDATGKRIADTQVDAALQSSSCMQLLEGVEILRTGPHEDGFAVWTNPFSSSTDLGSVGLTLLDKSGKEHFPFGGSGDGTENVSSFKVAPADVEAIAIHLRPYTHVATFENVSLKPGKQTDVKASVKSLASRTAQASTQNGPTIQLLAVSTPPDEPTSDGKREWWSSDGSRLTSPRFDSDVLRLTHGGSNNRELVFRLFGPGIFRPRVRSIQCDASYDAISGNGPMVQVHAAELFHVGKSVGHLDSVASEIESEVVKTDLPFPSLPRSYFPWVYDPNVNERCIIHTRLGSIGDADTATVKLRMATQEPVTASYHPIGKLLEVRHGEDPVLRQAAQRMIDDIRIVRTGPFDDGFAIWTSPFEINGEAGVAAIRLWALGHSVVTFDGVADGNELRFDFSEPPENVKSFDVIVRPYTHVITFEKVSLKPGKQTDTKVSIEPIGGQDDVVANTRFDEAAELKLFAQRLRAIAPADWTVEQSDEAFRLLGPEVADGETQASILLWFDDYNISSEYLAKRDKSLPEILVLDNTRIGQGYFVSNKESYKGWGDFFPEVRKIEPVDHIAFADLDGLRNVPWFEVALVRDVEVGADGRRVRILDPHSSLGPIDFGITSVTKYLVIGRLPDPKTASTDEEQATAERYLATVDKLRAEAESLGVPVVSIAELDWYTRAKLLEGSVQRVSRPADPNRIQPPACPITGEGLVAVLVDDSAAAAAPRATTTRSTTPPVRCLAPASRHLRRAGRLISWKTSTIGPGKRINLDASSVLCDQLTVKYSGRLRTIFTQKIILPLNSDSSLSTLFVEKIRRKNIRFSCYVRGSFSFRGRTSTIEAEFSPHGGTPSGIVKHDSECSLSENREYRI